MNIKALTEFYFVDLIAVICNVLAFVTAIKKKNCGRLRPMRLYVVVSLAFNLTIYVTAIVINPTQQFEKIVYTTMNVYTLLECTLIFFFVRNQTISYSQKIFQIIVYSSFTIFWFYILLLHLNFITNSATIMAGIEAFAIILISVPGLSLVIKNQRISTFIKSPEFYIFLAIISYFSYGIPHFLAIDLISTVAPQFVMVFQMTNLLFLCAFFLIIRKGFDAILPQS